MFTFVYTPKRESRKLLSINIPIIGLYFQVRPPAVKLDARNTAEMPYFSFFDVFRMAIR